MTLYYKGFGGLLLSQAKEKGIARLTAPAESFMITVLMATRNRAAILEKVLNSYTRLTSPPRGWEAIVVDNGSTDSTAEIVGRFSQRLPLTYLFESQPGKCRALNAGLEHCNGDLILFTDDDALPGSEWLEYYASAAEARPQFCIFGGPVRPKWPSDPPSWAVYDKQIEGTCFACSQMEYETGPFDRWFWGENFAVRAAALRKVGEFNPAVGPAPGSYAMGSESEMIERLFRAGYKGWWIGTAAVEHIIRPEQLTRRWMLQRAIKSGRGDYQVGLSSAGTVKSVCGLPRWVARKAGEQLGRVAMACVLGNAQERFVKRWYLNYYWGMLLQARQIRRREGGHQRRNES